MDPIRPSSEMRSNQGKGKRMLRQTGSAGIRRTVILATALTMAMALAAPVASMAAVVTPTIRVSTTSLDMRNTKRTVLLSGNVAASEAGRKVAVLVRKPGSSRWSTSSYRTITSTGAWSYRYLPRVNGTYSFRARYGTRLSVIRSVRVRRAPRYKLILASTTSTQDSGLFDVQIPAFEKRYPYWDVKVIAVGSGEALTLGQKKDADVIMSHSPEAEQTFLSKGYGKNSKKVMYNDFVLVGASSDPAGVRTSGSIVDCFNKIYSQGKTFVSRGDNSGTHAKEKSIWALAGKTDYARKSWYKSTGQGMGETLRIAGEMGGYTLVDRATWLVLKPTNLIIVQQGDRNLFNQYHVIEVVGAHNAEGARDYSNWVVSSAGQTLIRNFGRSRYGRSLFVPNAGPGAQY